MKTQFARVLNRVLTTAASAALMASCASAPQAGDKDEGTQKEAVGKTASALHASNIDAGTQLLLVTQADGNFPVLASNHRGYRLSCAAPAGLNALIQGAGFDPNQLPLIHPVALNSPELQQLTGHEPVRMEDLGVLPCNFTAAQGALLSIDVENERRYFLDLQERDDTGRFILRNVGCAELLVGMGLDLKAAEHLDYAIAGRYFRIDDAFDINCAAGTKPSDFVPRLSGSPRVQQVDRGHAINLVTFVMEHVPAGSVATLVPTSDDCGFLTVDGMTVTGRVDTTFAKGSCSATYVARTSTFETTPFTISLSTGCDIGTTANCASCGDTCATAVNADAACTNRTCQKVCKAGFADCNGTMTDGCEANLTTVSSCGACGTVCTAGPNGAASCSGGACHTTCAPGFADCNGNPADGCEANLASLTSCGTCGNACAGGANTNVACVAGACQSTCTASYRDCNGNAVDGCEANIGSTSHCGGCNVACAGGANGDAVCTNGTCGTQCRSGFGECDGNASNGCEASLASVINCGRCGNVCHAGSNASAACVNGDCQATCQAGFRDCNGSAADGCESNLASTSSCGACGNVCPGGAHMNVTCNGSSCSRTCAGGWGDCNGNLADGCETSLSTQANCGSCGHAATCGQCGRVCNPRVCGSGTRCCEVDEGGSCTLCLKSTLECP